MADIYETAKALEKKEFKVRCFETAKEAKKALLEIIPKKATVGAGGSMTLVGMGILDDLHLRGNKVFSTYIAKIEGSNPEDARNGGINADVYLSSANAITEKGEIYNTDMNGNRVAALFYGPEKVFIVAGKNKIVKSRSKARKRVKTVAGPLNTKRLKMNTPCFLTGKCADCGSIDRICRTTVIQEYAPRDREINVFLINEDLGY